ncbi:hypothetical protein RFI_26121, partial [Reticulomyxa filosa]
MSEASDEKVQKPKAFALDLKEVKLKDTKAQMKDKSDPVLSGYPTAEEIVKYDKYLQTFDIESWIDILKDVTFETVFVNITLKEGEKILELCKRVSEHAKASFLASMQDEKESKQEQSKKSVQPLQLNIKEEIPDLAKRIDDTITKMNSTNGVFAK